jgi:hypothetical protein
MILYGNGVDASFVVDIIDETVQIFKIPPHNVFTRKAV